MDFISDFDDFFESIHILFLVFKKTFNSIF